MKVSTEQAQKIQDTAEIALDFLGKAETQADMDKMIDTYMEMAKVLVPTMLDQWSTVFRVLLKSAVDNKDGVAAIIKLVVDIIEGLSEVEDNMNAALEEKADGMVDHIEELTTGMDKVMNGYKEYQLEMALDTEEPAA